MCQPRLAVTRFNVPAKCHFGCLWNQRAIETLLHKDYLINRIISASILSQLCDSVKREQENNQSIFVMKVCHPPSVMCSHLNPNEKWRYVFLDSLLLISCVFIAWLLYCCSKYPSFAVFSSHLSYSTVFFIWQMHIFFFTGCWTQSLYIILTLIAEGMSISFCWGYLMLIK